MKLQELFKEPKDSDFKWHTKKSDRWQGSFRTEKADYSLEIFKWGKEDEWTIEFRAYPLEKLPTRHGVKGWVSSTGVPKTDIIGNKQQFKVFQIVIPRIKEFIDNKKPHNISFSAKEKSREKLYSKMISRFASKWGYKIVNNGDDDFELERK